MIRGGHIMEQWYILIMAGIAAGLLSSMFGVGAGILLVPVLTIGFSYAQKEAQGMSLAVMVPMVLVGAIRYKMNPELNINLLLVLLIAVGAVVGAIIGPKIAFSVSNLVLKRMFACFMIVVGIKMLLNSFVSVDT
ncbi:hypothetical protein BVX97_05550 [bacterium E08(2017)]|nr:hypothetical protein BVX97_05550 [bacterium E08(2017)]